MSCEDGGIDYILGLAKNSRLCDEIRDEKAAVRAEHECTGEDARVFNDFRYKTRDSWCRERRVVGKAEYLPDKENPRFALRRNLLAERLVGPGALRGPVLRLGALAAGWRTASSSSNSASSTRSPATSCASDSRRSPTSSSATCVASRSQAPSSPTQRCRLLKIGAIVSVSVRRIYISLSSAFPLQELFARERRAADVRDGAGRDLGTQAVIADSGGVWHGTVTFGI